MDRWDPDRVSWAGIQVPGTLHLQGADGVPETGDIGSFVPPPAENGETDGVNQNVRLRETDFCVLVANGNLGYPYSWITRTS
jgi:hypothetical protein